MKLSTPGRTSRSEPSKEALAFAEKLDALSFAELVERFDLSICGHAPIAAALEYGKALGAKRAKLLEYTNSGGTTGDYANVVAYASRAIFK